MSSRRSDSAACTARDFWRELARHAGYDIPAAAQRLGLSLRQFERLCQRELDCTPTDWMHRARMSRAAELLATGQSIKLTATRLGYTLPANFSRDFKRHFGRTPRTLVPRPWLEPPASPTAPGSDATVE